MTQQIHGGSQVLDGTITSPKLAAWTSNVAAGGNKVTGLADGSAASDSATYGQLVAFINGLRVKGSVRVATTGAETFTISGGACTQIAGTTLDGVSPAVNDRVLVKNAPASTGAGTADDNNATGTSQPANGIYIVTSNTTNLSLARATDADIGAEVTAGLTTSVNEGTTPNADTQWTLITNDPITLNTTALQFTRTDRSTIAFTGGLTATGKTVKRDDLTGDVTTTGNGVATTIANGAVSLAKQANLAANSVIANPTGSPAVPAATSLTAAATASTVPIRDANANMRTNNLIENLQTVTSAAGTTTLTAASPRITIITGSTTQTVVMPDATTLVVGHPYEIVNHSSGLVTVNMNGGSLLQTMAASSFLIARPTAIGTSAGTWDVAYTSAGGSGTVTTLSVVSANGLAGSVANPGTTPAITLSTTITGLLKGNGTAISAAAAGPDYLTSSNFVNGETPSGTVNGSNPTFTLANTPIAGTVQLFRNGLLLEAGGGNDYTISGVTITMNAPLPASNEKLRACYWK